MVTCETCGSNEFESHEGFLYCTVCQTQSQDYQEQEHDYFESTYIRKKKVPKKRLKTVNDDGHWTSWEAFNFILYGMTKELEKCDAPEGFQSLVLKFWAFCLKASKACFTSRVRENFPELQLNYKNRDARILYNINTDFIKSSSRKRRRSTSVSVKSSISSTSSFLEESRHTLAKKRRKVILSDFEELLSTSRNSRSSLQNETLESLGSSDVTNSNVDETSEEDEISKFKKGLSKKDFKTFKKTRKSNELKVYVENVCKRNVKSLAKNKLLAILQLSLLMLNSEIQLSDLLRFIREGHLSYAKVTHFLPHYIKFAKKDFSYIDVVTDHQMPTHLSQRQISSKLACLLKIEQIPTPDMTLLIRRYCRDLNLPKQIAKFSRVIANKWVPSYFVPGLRIPLPSYEAWATVSVIFVMKLLFGLNDKTEIFLSELASAVNSTGKVKGKLFDFQDWQKFVECRKTVLIEHHYPTQEQLDDGVFTNTKKFIHTLTKESKDDFRSERFIPYKHYYMDQNLVKSIKETLDVLLTPIHFDYVEFLPSLTPQTSHLTRILENLHETNSESDQVEVRHAENILKRNFQDCTVDFTFNLEEYLQLLEDDDGSLLERFNLTLDLSRGKVPMKCSSGSDSKVLLNCSSKYWCLHYCESDDSHLSNFKEAIFENLPKNFQWLITECARMLEMNVRDVYNELVKLEFILMKEEACELPFPKGLKRSGRRKK